MGVAQKAEVTRLAKFGRRSAGAGPHDPQGFVVALLLPEGEHEDGGVARHGDDGILLRRCPELFE